MKEILIAMLLMMSLAPCCAAINYSQPVPKFGINHDFIWTKDEDIPALIQAMKDAHVQAVRIPMRWPTVEPKRGEWNFEKADKVVRALKEANIEILALFQGVPYWASKLDPATIQGFKDAAPPKDNREWADYVRMCVSRYKKDIRYWEVWNEENGQEFYKPKPDAKEYVQILKSAYQAVKTIDPKATVILGGLQMNGIIANRWSSSKVENYLQEVYDAGGKPYFDVVNTHPYVQVASQNEGPEYCAKLTRDTVELMKKNGDGDKPLWITETGTGTSNDVTREMQAEHLEGIYRELFKIPEVKSIYWFSLRDTSQSICGGEETMGMLTLDMKPKPAYEAFKKLAAEAEK